MPSESVVWLQLSRRWWKANAIAFGLSYVIYVPVAHGITGAHPGPLTLVQLVSHTVGLLVVSMMVLGAQLHVLESPFRERLSRLTWGALWFVATFWIGWYSFGPPANLFLSYVVLATATWIRWSHVAAPVVFWTMLVVMGMLAGLTVGMILFASLVATGLLIADTQSSAISHTAFWLSAAVGTGIVGGILSGLALPHALRGSISKGP